MSACEKCWRDAGGSMLEYLKLLMEREDHPCTPEEQAGIEPPRCLGCGSRGCQNPNCGPLENGDE